MNDKLAPIVIEFPLRGEWNAPNTPGKRIPSHGTDELGMRYAYDFFRLNWGTNDSVFFKESLLRYLIFGVPLKKCLCYGESVYAPCSGEVIISEDNYKERQRVHLISDLFVLYKNALTFHPQKTRIQTVCGNYIIMKCDLKYNEKDVFAMFAHFKTNSIKVKAGDIISKGQILGQVGHSGNSTSPHLHFQLMDNQDLTIAQGIPCCFEKYEIFINNNWEMVYIAIPKDKERIRYINQ